MNRWYRSLALVVMAISVLGGLVVSVPSAAARPPDARVRHLAPPPKPHVVQPHHPKPKRPGKVAPDWPGLPAKQGSTGTNTGGSTSGGSAPSGSTAQLDWHSGPVHTHPEAYAIFWGPYWKTVSGSTADWQIVENYFQDVGGTPFESILTQYYDGTGSIANTLNFGGAWFDTSSPSTDFSCAGTTIEDSAIQTEVANAIAANNWPTDGNVTYFVYTPPGDLVNAGDITNGCSGYVSTSFSQYCGYHFYLNSIGVAYAEIPYPGQYSSCLLAQSPNGNQYGDSLVNVTSHEQFESITDPQVQIVNGSIVGNGWYDASGNEMGDKCYQSFPESYTHLANGGQFNIQDEFANTLDQCVNEYAPPSAYVGSSNGIYAFSQVSGTWLWRYLAPCNVTSPVLMGDVLYFGACQTVYALDTASTTLLWSYQLGGTLEGAPIVNAGTGTVYASGRDGYVYALNATTGTLNWRTQIVNTDISVPVLGGGAVFVTDNINYTGTLTALNGSTGAQLWQDNIANYTLSSLAYGNDEVIVSVNFSNCIEGPCGSMNAYDATSGLPIWSGGPETGIPPLITNYMLYEVSGGSLFAFDTGMGAVLWTATVSNTANITATPAVVGGMVYIGLSDGTVAAVDATNGATQWTYLTGRDVESSVSVVNGVVYAGSDDTYTYALDAGVGTLLWRSATAGGVGTTPAVPSSHIVVSPFTGGHALGGSPAASRATPGPTIVSRAAIGSQPAGKAFTISNTGSQVLSWSLLGTPPSWLSVSPTSGTLMPGQSASATLTFDVANPSQAQTLTTTLQVADEYAGNTPVQVPVTAIIGPTDVLYVGSWNGVYAFDPGSGTWLWRYLAPCGVTAPVIYGGIVYFGACSTVFAMDAASTTLMWSYTLGATIEGTPVVSNGTVYASDRDGYVYALNATSGALNWHTQIVNTDISVPVVGGGAVFVTDSINNTGTLTALNGSTGAQLWQVNLTNDNVEAPAYGNGEVFDTINYSTSSAYDATSGLHIWYGVGSGVPAVEADNVLYVVIGGSLLAYDPNVGMLLWTATVSNSASICCTPTIVSGVAYLSMSDGTIVALNTSNQSILWQATADRDQPSPSVLGDGLLFAAGGDASVYALNPTTGSQVWRSVLAGGTQNTPALG